MSRTIIYGRVGRSRKCISHPTVQPSDGRLSIIPVIGSSFRQFAEKFVKSCFLFKVSVAAFVSYQVFLRRWFNFTRQVTTQLEY